MNCREYQNLIPEFLDGTIDRGLGTAVGSHIETCPRCARALAFHRAVFDALETAEPVKAPAGLADRILAVAEAETAAAHALRPSRFRLLLAIPVAAAACVLGTVAYLITVITQTPAAHVASESILGRLATIQYAPAMLKALVYGMIGADWFAAATAPVTVPGMGYDLPVYFIVFCGTMMSLTAAAAWTFFNAPLSAAFPGMAHAGVRR